MLCYTVFWLYARYLCSRDALGLKAKRMRDDRVSCIQVFWVPVKFYISTVFEKGPYEENIYEHIFFVRPLLEHGVYEKVPCAHACARLSRLSFRTLLTSG